jgi:PIN domain nuclease of toxin-antitoxin system
VKFLLDTHILLWAAAEPQRLSRAARALINDPENDLIFSAISIWEVAIKHGLGRNDFQVESRLLRRALLDQDYIELPLTGAHAAGIDALPPIHKDPFDRLLLAQAIAEGLPLLTSDVLLAKYRGPVRKV